MFRPMTRLGLLLAAASLAPSLVAGTLSDDLRADLSSLKKGETIDAIISMSEQFPVLSVDWDLHAKQVSRAERHEVVVSGLQDLAKVTQADLTELLKSYEGTPELDFWQSFWVTNAVHVRASRELIEQIARRSDVGQVNKNYPIENERPEITPGKPGAPDNDRYMADGLGAINAPAVWALGYTGAGTLVCNIDTGVDGNHSALSSRWRGNSEPAAECFYDPVLGQTFPYDSGQHGTHTMGTITGMSTLTGDTTGVAFGAQWICAATIDHPSGGGIGGTITLALQSFQWAVDPDGNPGTLDDVPDVISNSWGIPQGFLNQCDQTYWNAIDACEAAGSVVVFAAGNEGFTGLRSPSARATSIYSTFAVGALDISNPNAPFVAGFSSRGPSACSADPVLQIKPEISAPGVNTYSTVPGGGYQDGWSGTSMATPHVAGVIALMRDANPNLDVITIKQIIMDTAVDIDAVGDDNNTGHGMIDALACVLSGINGYGSVSGVVTGNGSPIPAVVSVQGSPQMVTCDINGNYTIGLPGDASYVLEYSYFGYVTGSANITIVGDADVVQNMNLALAPSATLSGTVYGPDTNPVPGATITVLNTPLAPVVANGSGFYTMSIPSGASYDVYAVGPGLGDQTQTVFIGGNTTLDFNLPNDPRFSPSDPDNYGYRIYDSNDAGGVPFVWNSISGTGTPIVLSDDNFIAVAVPFPFDFYGTTYNDIAVCSNGYVTAGSSNGSSSLGNGSIPSAGVPNNAIYAVWDDVYPVAGGTYVEYRPGSGEFVVEFNNVPYFGDPTPVSFQIILRDPAVWPTLTGDAQWVIHYNTGTRGSSTTGIENLAGNDGIQYALDGSYDVHSSEIVAGLSLLITTLTGDTGTLQGTITDLGTGNPIPGATVTAGASSVLTNGAGFYSMTLGVGNYTVEASAFGYNDNSAPVTISDDVVTTQNLALSPLPTAILSGTVFDPGSQPFEGAVVTVLSSPYAPVVTDVNGFYSIEILDNTSWTVQAVGGGQGSQTLPVTMNGNTTLNFTLPGDPMFSPTGPDSYGYRIFDSNDGTGSPVYSWSSIAGSGTQISLTDDSYLQVNTPFSYNFYGAPFTTVSVCSNGYLVPGVGFTTYSNTNIPTTGTPNGAVYGVWDDLNPGSGGTIWTMNSPAHGGFVVEYNQVFFFGTTTPVSFQMIILDPSIYTTPTGDAAFLIHYFDGDRLSSTIGIENGAGTDGLQYVLNGAYDITASPIAGGGISLLVTTNPFGMTQGEDEFAPNIVHTPLGDTSNTAGPYTVQATITDASGIDTATLQYRVNGGSWLSVGMTGAGNLYSGDIPGPRSYNDVIDYHITAVDGSVNSNSVTTPDYSFTVVNFGPLLCEDFESGTLGDFTVQTIDPLGNTWGVIDYGAPQGYTAYIQYSAPDQVDHALLISPAIDCTNMSYVELTFWHLLRMGYSGAVTDAYVKISTDGGVTFPSTVAEWHANNEIEEILIEGVELFDITALAAGQSDVRVAFEFYDIYDWYWYMDDFCVNGAGLEQGLDAPVVTISYTQAGNQVHLDWADVAGATSYKVYSSPDGYGPWTLLATVGSSSYNTVSVLGDRYYQVTADNAALSASTTAFDPYHNRVFRAMPGKDAFMAPNAVQRPVTPGVVSETYRK